MSNHLELTQLPDGTIVLRRSDDHENPIVKIEFSGESKEFLNGAELSVAKEMIRAGIESVSGNAIDFDDFFARDSFAFIPYTYFIIKLKILLDKAKKIF